MIWTPVFWLLAFVPALVALYFLKLKRRDVVISSTLLWKRSLEDLHVNAPFQKLRKSWLLLLQLLVLAGLILAAWRPRISASFAGGRNLIVLVDHSASMAAREREGTRLDLAKRGALALVSTLGSSDRMTLLVFSSRTTVLEPLTGDRALLESRIRAIEPAALPTNLEQALLVAHSIAETLPESEVQVFGDGCYGDMSALPPEAKRMRIKLVSESTALDNAGITEMDVRRSFEGKGKTEVFALIESSGKAGARLTVSLSVDGALRDAREIDVAPGGSAPVVFDASDVESGIVRVSIDSADALAADDEAWARITPPRILRVLVVGKPNPWIDLVLKSNAGLKARRMEEDEYWKILAEAKGAGVGEKLAAEVVILDRASATPPAGAALGTLEPLLPAMYIACRPPLPPRTLDPEVRKLPVVVDWDRAHPVNRFLVFTDLHVEESQVFRPEGEYRSLVDADAGSVMGTLRYYPPGGRPVPVVWIGFDILKSNWPIGHYSFPIFFSNAIAWLGGGNGAARGARGRTGEPLVYDPALHELPGAAGIRFRSPSGREIVPVQEAAGSFVLSASEEAGVYEVLEAGEVRAHLPVSLLCAAESRLEPSRAIEFGDFKVEVQASLEKGARDLWKYFTLAALVFCLLEWQVYNRRLAG